MICLPCLPHPRGVEGYFSTPLTRVFVSATIMKNPQRLARLNLVNPIMVEAQRPCTEDADGTQPLTASSDGKRTFRLPPNIALHMLTMSKCAGE